MDQATTAANTEAPESGFGCLLRQISKPADLHPVFAEILAAHGMPQRCALPEVHRARCGRRRAYLAASSADAYDRAFANWPNVPTILDGPAGDGYFDREQQACDAEEAKREAAEEREQS